MPAVAAATAGLGSALSTSMLVRRSGRERVGTGGVADAAFAGGGGPTSEVRLDEAELAEMATTDFAPPTELTPRPGRAAPRRARATRAQGGVADPGRHRR